MQWQSYSEETVEKWGGAIKKIQKRLVKLSTILPMVGGVPALKNLEQGRSCSQKTQP